MPELPGRKRREYVRRVIGKPGSIRRWLLANLVGLPLVLATMNLYLVIAAVLLSTMWVMYLRGILVEGDEDEMSAWIRWQISRRNPDRIAHVSQPEPVDSTQWFNTRANTFIGVPPPPVLDNAFESPTADDDLEGA